MEKELLGIQIEPFDSGEMRGVVLNRDQPMELRSDKLQSFVRGKVTFEFLQQRNLHFMRGNIGGGYDVSYHPMVTNSRQNLNVFPHSDGRDLLLYSSQSRPAQNTAIDFADKSFAKLMDIIEGLEVSDNLRSFIQKFKALGGFELFKGAGGMLLMEQWADNLVRLISRDLKLLDEDVLRITAELGVYLKARGFTYEHVWKLGDVLWIRRELFHRRVCEAVDLIRLEHNPLVRINLEPGELFDITQFQ